MVALEAVFEKKMSLQANLPFVASGALLTVWATGKFDSDVTFLTVVFIFSYALASSLVLETAPIALPSVDHFSSVFHNDQRALGYFLVMAFCFACGAVGTAVFAFSPFAGTLLYSAVVSSLFRDVSVVGDARIVAWLCVLVAGTLSEHIFRLNLAAGLFALIALNRQVRFEGHGTFEAASLLAGMLFLAVHDWTVRLILEPFRLMFRAGFLAITAFVMVDSTMELATLPMMRSLGSTKLVSLKWTDYVAAASDASTLTWESFPSRLSVAAPALSCMFTAACFMRAIRANWKLMDWTKCQQLSGVAVGTALGLQLWAKYAGLHSLDLLSPLALCWVFTALLLCLPQLFASSSAIVPMPGGATAVDGIESSSAVWHATYWRKAGKQGSSSGKGKGGASKKQQSQQMNSNLPKTPYPSLLLMSFSATYPELYEIATQLEDAHFHLEAALARYKRFSSSSVGKNASFERAKQAFACNSLVNSLVKLTEDLSSKLQERIAMVKGQATVFAQIDGNDPSSSSMSQKAKQRVMHLSQDLTAIHSYLELLRTELASKDDDTLKLLEQTFTEARNKMVSSTHRNDDDENHLAELNSKRELDELDQMCEAIRKRIKHRKKKDNEIQQQQQQQQVSPRSMAAQPAMDASFNVTLPVLNPGGNVVLYPTSPGATSGGDAKGGSDSLSAGGASPSTRSRSRVSWLFRSKKPSGGNPASPPPPPPSSSLDAATQPQQPLDVSMDASERQSASSGGAKSNSSSRKWGSFMNRSSRSKGSTTN